MFKKLYNWTLSLANSPHATWALGLIAFAESSFFPIPPDVILIPMSLANPKKAWFYAAVCSVCSVAGGVVGYLIGAMLYDTLGIWLINFYGYATKMEAVKQAYAQYGAWLILLKGVTPIPFKLVTIVSGLLGYNFPMFLLLAAITRTARFFILAAILNKFGEPIRLALEKHFALFMGLIVVCIVAGFYIATRVL